MMEATLGRASGGSSWAPGRAPHGCAYCALPCFWLSPAISQPNPRVPVGLPPGCLAGLNMAWLCS